MSAGLQSDLYFDFVGNLAQNNYRDFMMSMLCPEAWGSLDKETIDCGPEAVIDIIWARVALFGRPSLCDNNFDDIVADIIRDFPPFCIADLPFSV